MARIGKTFTFEAAHRLQHHEGKCRNLHGHSYRVDVTIEGDLTARAGAPDEGMVLDFGVLSDWWKPLEAILDHVTILETSDPLMVPFVGYGGVKVTVFPFPPTAENLAALMLEDLQMFLLKVWPEGFPTPTVRVWETAKSWAEA